MQYNSREEPSIKKMGVSVPEEIFTQVMPVIRDIVELKVILYIFHCLSQKEFVSWHISNFMGADINHRNF